MPMRPSKGNMYTFVDFTFNPIKGKCMHDCSYCYVKRWGKQKKIHLDEKELRSDLGSGKFIFVGSSVDMFADDVPDEWIFKVLEHCRKYPDNTYLFQSKKPYTMVQYEDNFPPKTVVGTTLETNRDTSNISKAPSTEDRVKWMLAFKSRKMVTIEPILDFDLIPFVNMIGMVNPEWVNIGADSKGHELSEPPKEKIEELITELKKFTQVKLKDNLKRLMK